MQTYTHKPQTRHILMQRADASIERNAPLAITLALAAGICVLSRLVDMGDLLLPALSLVFLVFGTAARDIRLLVPGGVIAVVAFATFSNLNDLLSSIALLGFITIVGFVIYLLMTRPRL